LYIDKTIDDDGIKVILCQRPALRIELLSRLFVRDEWRSRFFFVCCHFSRFAV